MQLNSSGITSPGLRHTNCGGDTMCHRKHGLYRDKPPVDSQQYGDGDVPEVDTEPYKNVEPLPESSRERRDGPGGD